MKPESARTQLSTQEAYVKEHKRYHNKITLCRLTIFLLFLTTWELAADLKRIDAFFFSSPSRVLTCLVELVTEKNLFLHIGITLYETIISFLLVFHRRLRSDHGRRAEQQCVAASLCHEQNFSFPAKNPPGCAIL